MHLIRVGRERRWKGKGRGEDRRREGEDGKGACYSWEGLVVGQTVAQAAGQAHSSDITIMLQPRKHPQHQLLRQVGELHDREATPLFIHQQTDLQL
jgi:hypothetical protein